MYYQREKLKAIRIKKGISIAQLSRITKIAYPTLWVIENRVKNHSKHIPAIAKALNVPIEDLEDRRLSNNINGKRRDIFVRLTLEGRKTLEELGNKRKTSISKLVREAIQKCYL